MIDIQRRLLAGLLLALGASGGALGQAYPAQPVKLLVAFPPGGGADLAARILAQHLGEQLKQTVVVENVSGAGGIVGTARAAQAAPDGYTLLVGTPSTHGANTAVYKKLSYDAVRDFAPVMLIGSSPLLLIGSPAAPGTVGELLAQARARPAALNYASYGLGSINHLAGELFTSLADLKVGHVPYRGGAPAVTDLLAGRVEYMFDGTASLGHIRSGKLKLLAVASKSRWAPFPGVPTVAESGVPGFDAITWYGLFAPAGTPRAIVDLLNAKANAAVATPAAKAAFEKLSVDLAGGPPDVLAQQVRSEIDKWVGVADKRNIRLGE